MQKTKKSIAKRFKISAKGKLIRRSPGRGHLLSKQGSKRRRKNTRDKVVTPGRAANLLRALPHGLA